MIRHFDRRWSPLKENVTRCLKITENIVKHFRLFFVRLFLLIFKHCEKFAKRQSVFLYSYALPCQDRLQTGQYFRIPSEGQVVGHVILDCQTPLKC